MTEAGDDECGLIRNVESANRAVRMTNEKKKRDSRPEFATIVVANENNRVVANENNMLELKLRATLLLRVLTLVFFRSLSF